MTRGAIPHRRGAVLLAVLVSAGALQLSLPGPVEAADGVTETASTTYTVNPPAGRLDVQVDITVKNTKPDTTTYDPCIKWVYDPIYGYHTESGTCPHTTRYYVNEAFVWLESVAASIKVTANAGTPKITLYKKGDGYNEYRITYKAVYKGQTRSLHLTYQIRGGAPRSTADTRIGAAYVSFCVTANGYDGGSTRVVLGSSYDVTVDPHNGEFTKSTSKGAVTYTTSVMSKPDSFWACFDGDNLTGFTKTRVTSPAGRPIEIQAWPEDPDWHGQVTRQIQESLGTLEALIGRPLPGTGTVVVREVSDTGLGAYVGTFDATTGVARVSEDFTQPGVVAHELSHAWFNDALFTGRWLSEGSAGWAESTVTHLSCREPGAFPGTGEPAIANWTFAGPRATAEELDVVDYEYAAACYIISSVATRMGEDRMRDVLAALLDRTNPYRSGDLVLPGRSGPGDWRRWLDAVDELGLVPAGVDDLDYAQGLLLKYGAGGSADSMTARSRARARYHALARSVGPWILPEAILRPMGEWRFDDATAAMDVEAATYAAVQEVTARLPDVDAADGPVREAVAGAKSTEDLRAALDRATEQQAAANLMADARSGVAAKRDIVAEIGLLGTDFRPDLASGLAAVTTIDLDAAKQHAGRIGDTLAGASGQGTIRIGAAIGLALMLLIVFGIARRRRRRRAMAASLAFASALATDAPAAEPGPAPEDATEDEAGSWPDGGFGGAAGPAPGSVPGAAVEPEFEAGPEDPPPPDQSS